MIRWLAYRFYGGRRKGGWMRNPGTGINPAPANPVWVLRRDGQKKASWSNSLDWKRRNQPSDIVDWQFLDDDCE